jgi:hypothetical protein
LVASAATTQVRGDGVPGAVPNAHQGMIITGNARGLLSFVAAQFICADVEAAAET